MILKPKNFFNQYLEMFPYPIIIFNENLNVVLANYSAVHKLRLSYERQEFITTFFDDISQKEILKLIEQSENLHYIQETLNFRSLEETTIILKNIDKKLYRYYMSIFLPNTFKEEYKNLKQKYDSILEHMSDSVLITDSNQKILEANNAFSEITGYDLQEVLGRFPTLLSSGRHDDSFYKQMFLEIENKGFFKGNITDRKKSGEIINVVATIKPLRDDYGDIKNYIGILKDTTEITKLKHISTHTKNKDPLTNVQNRESILHILDIKCELSSVNNQIAVMFIDLNKFKQVNDTYGHRYGDFILSSAANRMQKALRENDIIGRYGGDEFIIMLERITKKNAYEVAKKIQESLSKPYVVDEQVIDFISGSIGIAFAPFDSKKATELIEKADIAMYQAKQNLSSENIMLSDNIIENENNNKILKTELLHAIENDEFYLRIQPIVCQKTQKIVGGEILSRWLNLKFDEVYPSKFISLIQILGMSKKFDLYILSKTIELLEEQKDIDKNFFLNINFSAEQFSDSRFIDMLEDILSVKPWVKDYIVIEITESAMMIDMERTTEHLNAIRFLGFKIAIDDFGTGFSSLAYLKHFTIDYLKIDKSFIDNLEDDKKDIEILKTIVTLANAIGAKVIVEGVERESQFEIIQNLGVDYIQGFYFHKPILPDTYFSKFHS